MALLDTNVVSELMRSAPSSEVLSWMDRLPTHELFVSAIKEAEIRTGIAVLSDGMRRQGLAGAAERTLGVLFAGRILPFDGTEARSCDSIAAVRRAVGHPLTQSDCRIAAIAHSRGMSGISPRQVLR